MAKLEAGVSKAKLCSTLSFSGTILVTGKGETCSMRNCWATLTIFSRLVPRSWQRSRLSRDSQMPERKLIADFKRMLFMEECKAVLHLIIIVFFFNYWTKISLFSLFFLIFFYYFNCLSSNNGFKKIINPLLYISILLPIPYSDSHFDF